MSSKRKKTSLSDASGSGSDSNDGGKKKWKEGGASSSGSSDEGGNKSRSGSGSDSGTERSRSGSRAGSRNSGKSNSSKSSDSGTEGSDRPGSKKASGGSSSGSSSSGSGKSKKLKKASSRKPSSKMETSTLSHDSDSDEEQEKPKRKKSESPRNKKSDRGSSSDEETWRDQFDDGLNDELIGDEDDKRMLEEMTEKEREEEIFKRAEKREELKKRFEITKKLEKQKKNDDQEDGELNENLSDEDMKMDYQTSSGRKKKYEEKYDKKFSALSELKAKREEKERKDAIRKQKESKKKPQDSDSDLEKLALKQANKKQVLKASDVYSSSSDEGKDEERRRSSSSSSSSSSVSSISSGESDTERHGSKKLVKKAQILETQDQLEQIRLSRHKIEKFVHLPIFKRTAIGCYVRIGIGNDPTSQTNKPVYRVAEIVEICETAKTYSVGKAKTNIGLKLKHGKEERVFRVAFVSNQQFSESEFNKWKEACVKGSIDLPSVQTIATKANDINKALNYRFSSADVDKVLASKEKFKVNPVNYAVHKAKLQKEKLQMEEAGNKEEADKIAKRLVEIEERAEELDKKRCSSISNIAYINNRNRKANIIKAEKAIYEEIKQKQMDGVDEDPFTRRRTAPKLPSAKKDENEEMTSELLLKLQQEKDQEKTKKEEVVEKKVPKSLDVKLPKALQNKPEIKNDLFDAHDFDVEINVSEIQQNSIPSSINLKPVNNNNAAKASNGPTKRSLKIDEWKKKRGII